MLRTKRLAVVVIGLAVVFASPAFGATILVISDSKVPGEELLHLDHEDDTLVQQLLDFGYTVDTSGMDKAFQGDPSTKAGWNAAIAAADLVIVSRRTNSGAYNNMQWNGIAKPLLLMSGYLTRSTRWGWTSGGSGMASDTETDMIIETGQAGHPFFADVTSPVSLFDWTGAVKNDNSGDVINKAPRPVYLPNSGTADEGVLLATYDGRPIVIDIPAGTDLGGSYGTTGARRALLSSWSYDNGDWPQFGDYHTDDFDTVFENMITELIPEPATMSLLALGGLVMLKRRRRR